MNQSSSLLKSSLETSKEPSFLQAFSFLVVEETDIGKRLDSLLQEKLLHYSRSQIQEYWDRVRVNGKSKKKQYRVRKLDRIDLEALEESSKLDRGSMDLELFEKLELEILYEDEYLFVLNKPSGVVVHPSRGHSTGTLCHALGHKLKGFKSQTQDLNIEGRSEFRPGVVHRLDKDTSGLMLWAKDAITQSRLATAFQKREVKKEYLALVHGETPLKGEFSQAIGLNPKNRIHRSIHPDAIRPKEAKTLYRRIDLLPFSSSSPSLSPASSSLSSHGSSPTSLVRSSPYKDPTHFHSASPKELKAKKQAYSLLRVHILTGRTHQIRVHLAENGHPIFGDPIYNHQNASIKKDPIQNTEEPTDNLTAIQPKKTRMALHSCFLSFVHPVLQSTMHFELEVPLWFKEILENLKKTRKI